MSDAGTVCQNLDRTGLEYPLEDGFHLGLIGDIASLRLRFPTSAIDFVRDGFRLVAIKIKNADTCAACGKSFGDGATDAAGSPGYDCGFVIQWQVAHGRGKLLPPGIRH